MGVQGVGSVAYLGAEIRLWAKIRLVGHMADPDPFHNSTKK
jgi:hypothetical protein